MEHPEEALFLGVSVRVFLDDISVWVSGLSGVDCPPQSAWASSNPSRAWKNKRQRKADFAPLFPASLFVFSSLILCYTLLCALPVLCTAPRTLVFSRILFSDISRVDLFWYQCVSCKMWLFCLLFLAASLFDSWMRNRPSLIIPWRSDSHEHLVCE